MVITTNKGFVSLKDTGITNCIQKEEFNTLIYSKILCENTNKTVNKNNFEILTATYATRNTPWCIKCNIIIT